MYTYPEVLTHIRELSQGKTLVLTTGVFDLFHEEHKNFLQKAKSVGDILVVGVESDVRVKALKGDDRPIRSESERIADIEHEQIADVVFLLPEQFSTPGDWEEFVNQLRPNLYAVSSHTGFIENKRALVQKYGGDLLIVHEYNPAVSTTNIIRNMQ